MLPDLLLHKIAIQLGDNPKTICGGIRMRLRCIQRMFRNTQELCNLRNRLTNLASPDDQQPLGRDVLQNELVMLRPVSKVPIEGEQTLFAKHPFLRPMIQSAEAMLAEFNPSG